MPDPSISYLEWSSTALTTAQQKQLHSPQPEWMRARWAAGVSVPQVTALLEELETGVPALRSATHIRLADRRESGVVVLECCCGTAIMAQGFNRDESSGWWTQHLKDVATAQRVAED
ncbi:MAG: hypothetical protein ACTILB_15325 [Brevibacterium aurantiacum]|uniref:hypothetical protein n=1 Tax=Microbacterium gubbeenense TaxID=159896 RepID=UPI000408C79C|nr:hypothetical protein [Microbacterium gubbeenense]